MTRFVSMQNFYNLVYREEEREMLPLCRDQGVGVIPGARWRAAGWLAHGRPRRPTVQGPTPQSTCYTPTRQPIPTAPSSTPSAISPRLTVFPAPQAPWRGCTIARW